MAKITIWSNYEIVDGIKVFGEYREVYNAKIVNDEPISDFDKAKNELWDALDAFRRDFDIPTHNGILYEFSRTEMDLEHHDNHEYFGMVEGFEYDDSVTMWSAAIYENDEM